MGAIKISPAAIELAPTKHTSVYKPQKIKGETDDSFIGFNVDRLRQLS